jgi:hypothetical protein
MILDAKAQLHSTAAGQAITADAVSENSYDLGVVRDVGVGEPLYVVLQITESFNTLTTLDISLVSADVTALTTNKTLHFTKSFALARLLINNTFVLGAVPHGVTRRHVGLDYNVVGTDPTTGKIKAWIVNRAQANQISEYA